MESDSNAPPKGTPNTASGASVANPPPAAEESKSSPVPSMSGALQGDDAKDAPRSTLDAGESAPNGAVDAPVPAPDPIETSEPSTSLNAAGEAMSTPSSSKRPSNNKRKSTGGVPEHKSKKVNKKKSLPKITHLDAQPGELYFARLKSYPPWPAIICDEGMLPSSLLSTRPVTTKQADGSYREAYADGGKRAYERTFPIMFLHTNEFAWLPNTELTKLDPEECKEFSEKGKTKSLIQAYHVAAEGHDLEYFKAMLLDHQKAMQEDQEMREAREAAKAERADKKKRKSGIELDGDGDVDMEEAGDGDSKPESKKSSKKRKKEVDSDGDDKPSKTPKTTTKLKLTTPKAPSTNEKKAKGSSKTPKSRSDHRKSKAAASDDEAAVEEVKEPEKELNPAEAKAMKEKEVLFYRHKLQKGFLSREQAPQESEMAVMSTFIAKVEEFEDLEVSIIRSTKINKVLKAIIKLNSIPKDEEFNFKARALTLLSKWSKAMGTEAEGMGTTGADKEDQPTTNGVHKEDKDPDEAKQEGSSAAVPGDEATDSVPNTTVEAAAREDSTAQEAS